MAQARAIPTMTADATAIYDYLRLRASLPVPVVTYSDVQRRTGIPHRGTRMNQALWILVRRCQAKGLPAISALVVGKSTGIPGRLYYPAAHRVQYIQHKPRAVFTWADEVVAVRNAAPKYPPVL